jgi:hypothetical protein
MAMNLMQKDGEKGSLRGKIKRAGWDEAYLARLLTHFLKCDRPEGRLGLACSTAERRYILDVPGTGFPFKRPGADDPSLGAAA